MLKPIDYVNTSAVGKEVRDRSNISQIVFHQALAEALDGIDEFSHLFIVFWMHEIPKESRKLKVRPRCRSDMPLLGVYATRTPYRPNPIGLTLVEVLEVKDNVITVRGLDAVDGTPILDIKPFDYWDMVENARVPDWWMKLERRNINSNII